MRRLNNEARRRGPFNRRRQFGVISPNTCSSFALESGFLVAKLSGWHMLVDSKKTWW